jgi:hypothetical protein
MRIAGIGGIALALLAAACGGPDQSAADAPAEPAKTVMKAEAERACAEMTNFSPAMLAGKPAERQALLRREYDLCVKSVASGDGEAPTAVANAPTLRGRSSTP